MIAGWTLGVLCCHALAVFDGRVLAALVPEPPGVAEVEECLGNYTNGAVYNVGPHLVLKNWTLTPTQLSVFCRTNVTDLYRCIDPYIETEGDLTSSIIRTFEHLCDDNQQPEWSKYSVCVAHNMRSCLAELEDNDAVITRYGLSVGQAHTEDQCNLMKEYARCVSASTTQVCDEAAAAWHVGLIRRQWGPYLGSNKCDVFDDIVIISPPPEVATVMSCMRNYTDPALYNVGLHLVLRPLEKGILNTDTEVSVFCKTDVLELYTCIGPYREAEAKTLTWSLTSAFEHLCDEKQQKEWVKHSDCALTDIDQCLDDFENAWITKYEFEVKSDEVPYQCRQMKDYVKCVSKKNKEMCGKAAADWHTGVIRKIWRPYRDIIACDVYGPTGGTVGLIAGVVVGLLLISICGFLIWYKPKKVKDKRQLRTSTAL